MKSDCKNEMCQQGCYPWYGLAPHSHNFKKTGSFIGSTEMKQKKDWPENFIESTDPEDAGMGVYYCPSCKEGMPK